MEYIEAMLRRGEVNAISAEELVLLSGYKDSRELRLEVERERQKGVLILSSKKGYYLPSVNPETALAEIQAFVRVADSRLVSNRLSVHHAKEYLKLHSGDVFQESMFS